MNEYQDKIHRYHYKGVAVTEYVYRGIFRAVVNGAFVQTHSQAIMQEIIDAEVQEDES